MEFDKQQTRNVLIEAAKTIFAEKGYEGATVKDISDRANVNVSLISYYFGGKEGLYRTLILKLGGERLDIGQRLLSDFSSPEEFRFRLKMFAEDFVRVNLEDMDFMRIIQRDFDGGHPLALESFRDVFINIFKLILGYLEKAQHKGILSAKVDVHMAASIALGALVHNLRMDFLRREMFGCSMLQPEFFEKFIEQFVFIICDGIMAARE